MFARADQSPSCSQGQIFTGLNDVRLLKESHGSISDDYALGTVLRALGVI